MDSQEGIDQDYTLDYFVRPILTEILTIEVKTPTKPLPGQRSVNPTTPKNNQNILTNHRNTDNRHFLPPLNPNPSTLTPPQYTYNQPYNISYFDIHTQTPHSHTPPPQHYQGNDRGVEWHACPASGQSQKIKAKRAPFNPSVIPLALLTKRSSNEPAQLGNPWVDRNHPQVA